MNDARSLSPSRLVDEAAAGGAIRDDCCVTIDPGDAGDDATRIRALLDRALSAASGDTDLYWIVRQNLAKRRLQRWPEQVARVRALLAET